MFSIGSCRLQGSPLDDHFGDMSLLHFLKELGIIKLRLRSLLLASVELVEHGHQHQGDDHPDCNAFKIIHDNSLKRRDYNCRD